MSLTDIYIFNILKPIITFFYLFVVFIYLCYIVILYIYLIIYLLSSAVRIHRPFLRFTNSRFTVKCILKYDSFYRLPFHVTVQVHFKNMFQNP